MRKIFTLLKLEFKSKFSSFSSAKKSTPIAKLVVSLVFYALLVYLIFQGALLLFAMFEKAGLAAEALVLLCSIIFLFLLFTGISSTIKVLYYKGDNIILMRFPVSGGQIFFSKTLFLIINQMIVTATLVIPFMIAYAAVIPVDGYFYGMVPIVVLFLVFIPFFLSNVLAIPIMQIANKISNRYGFMIAMMSTLMIGLFAIYMLLFSSIVEYLRDSSFSVFSASFVEFIRNLAKYLIPTRYFADILIANELYIAFPVLIMLTAVSLSLNVFIISKYYQKTLLRNVEIEGSAFKRKTSNRKRRVFTTLMKKEFVQVFRSVNYSFQYFVIACSMPLMVYFCNRIVQKIALTTVGEQISAGMTILVMLIFATVITSFSATSVTREGNNFYHTKVMPVSFHKQLAAKFIMYLLVSFASNLICILILWGAKLMDLKIALWVFGIVQLISVSETLLAMRMDIRKPRFNIVGEGEVVNNNTNTTTAILVGFLIAMVVGMASMTLANFLTVNFMLFICTAIAVIVAVFCITAYFVGLKKAYNKIMR